MSILDDAVKFAVDAHAGMTRKIGNKPYILHPMEVAAIVGTMTGDEETLAAAVLHDVVEDTEYCLEDIEAAFGRRVAALVSSETEDKRPEMPPEASWRVRKEETLRTLAESGDIAVKMLWLGDKLSNMRSFYSQYLIDGDSLWKHFNQPDPAQQAWYYRAVAEHTRELAGYPAWREYNELTEKVFNGVKEI